MLGELEQLNGRRHQTFFHLGFRDALFDAQPRRQLPADNDSRRRWYASGYVSALARTDDYPAIARLYNEFTPVPQIAAAADGAAGAAAWIVFRALCEASRFAEAGALLKIDVVALSPPLRQALLATATTLLRASRATDARVFVEALWAARPEEPSDDEAAFWLSVKRRRALCFRQLGNHRDAIALLNELVESGDVVTHAVALTDLGLIQIGVRRIGDLTLPKSDDERATFIESMERGESYPPAGH